MEDPTLTFSLAPIGRSSLMSFPVSSLVPLLHLYYIFSGSVLIPPSIAEKTPDLICIVKL
jgi:hypothetical protein